MILRIYKPLAENPSYEYYPELQAVREKRRNLDFLMSHGPSLMAGTPDDFIEQFYRLDKMGVNEVVLTVDGINHESRLETIDLFGRHIIPEFKKFLHR